MRLEPLESRLVPAGFAPAADIFSVSLPADAEAFPTCDIDVLANDAGTDLEIVSLGEPSLGTVMRLSGAGPDGRDLVRYAPGPTFRGRDFFRYAVTDVEGREEWQLVSVGYEQDPVPFEPWTVVAPSSVATPSGVEFRFVDDVGAGLLAVEYGGTVGPVNVGVLLRWEPGVRPGTFTAPATEGADFYPQSGGAAWIVGSIDGVNRLLGSLSYVPAPGFAAPEGVGLTVQSHLYSRLNVTIGVRLADVAVRVVPDSSAPRPDDDTFSVHSTAEPTLLDVLANDEVVDGPLELVDVVIEGHSDSIVSVDPLSNAISYLPQQGFMGFERLFYTVRDAAGRRAQGRAVVTVMPEIMAVARFDQRGTGIVVVDAGTQRAIAEFAAFPERASVDVSVAVADVDGDGMSEVVAMEQGGRRRMRVFTPRGALVEEAVVRPFAGRPTSRVDMEIGDLDSDGRGEMIFAATSARGVEIRAIDAATKKTEMSAVLGGMTGAPEVSLDAGTGTLAVVARTPAGGVMLATMTPGGGPATRRMVVSDREVRAAVRRNGPLLALSLDGSDTDGDGTTESLVGMTFRNGLVRVMEVEGGEAVRVAMERRVPAGTSAIVAAAAVDAAAREPAMAWWGASGAGMADGGTDPRVRGRIRAVAIG